MSAINNDKVPPSSIKGKLRDIFHPKSKVTVAPSPAPLPTISLPSRIPIRKKRSFRDVADDEQDRGSAINPRARVRPRLDSTSSISTLRGKIVLNKSSNESIKTIHATNKLKRTPSTSKISLNPGRSTPAKAILTRTTSHNQIAAPPVEKRSIIPFPARKATSSKRTSKDIPFAATTTHKGKSVRRTESSRSLSKRRTRDSISSGAHDGPSALTAAMTSAVPHSSSRRSPSASAEDASGLGEDAMIKHILGYVVNDIDDDDLNSTDARIPLASSHDRVSLRFRAPAVRNNEEDIPGLDWTKYSSPRSSLDSTSSTSSVFSKGADLKSRLERFDVKILPVKNHVALWDLKLTDVYVWSGLMCFTDSQFKRTGFESAPPVRNINIEFRSVEESTVEKPGPNTSTHERTADTSSSSVVPRGEYFVEYTGHSLRRDKILTHLDPEEGICVEDPWYWGPFPSTSAHLDVVPSGTSYVLKFYVPVPMRLFKGREFIQFKVKSKVVFGDWEISPVVAHSGTVKVSIEHLKKEVHMDGTRPLEVL